MKPTGPAATRSLKRDHGALLQGSDLRERYYAAAHDDLVPAELGCVDPCCDRSHKAPKLVVGFAVTRPMANARSERAAEMDRWPMEANRQSRKKGLIIMRVDCYIG